MWLNFLKKSDIHQLTKWKYKIKTKNRWNRQIYFKIQPENSAPLRFVLKNSLYSTTLEILLEVPEYFLQYFSPYYQPWFYFLQRY